MSIGKDDSVGRELFGEAYDRIPKSVFAVAAWYLADACSEDGVGNGQAIARLREEIECLSGQLIDPSQGKRAIAALARCGGAK